MRIIIFGEGYGQKGMVDAGAKSGLRSTVSKVRYLGPR